MEQPPAMPPTLPAVTPKKGIPALGWVGIGCGGLLILGIVVVVIGIKMFLGEMEEFTANPEKAMAELIVKADPDLQKISEDDEAGEMTIRTKDGKEVTVSYKDISEGKIVVSDSEGKEIAYGPADLSEVPEWVPRVSDFSDGVSLYHQVANGTVTGQFTGKTKMSEVELKTYFIAEAKKLGLGNSSSKSTSVGGAGTMQLEFSGGGKTLTVMTVEKSGAPTVVSTAYSEK